MTVHTFPGMPGRFRGFKPYTPKALGQMEFKFGNVHLVVTAGPYMASGTYPHHFKVKLAKEIDMACNVSVPIADFSTPDPEQVRRALTAVLDAAYRKQPVYVGCMGGIGRTGMFLALLAKLEFAYSVERYGKMPFLRDEVGAVEHVRSRYLRHAVETKGQHQFVEDFDLTSLMKHLDWRNGVGRTGIADTALRIKAALRRTLHALLPRHYPRRTPRRTRPAA